MVPPVSAETHNNDIQRNVCAFGNAPYFQNLSPHANMQGAQGMGAQGLYTAGAAAARSAPVEVTGVSQNKLLPKWRLCARLTADIMEWIGYTGKGPSPIFCDNKAAVQLSDSGISSMVRNFAMWQLTSHSFVNL